MGATTDRLLRSLRQTRDISTFLRLNRQRQVVPPLSAHLEELLIKKERRKADVIAASQLSATYAYQIFDGRRKPTRDKLLLIAFAFPLDLAETETLLSVAGAGGLYVKNRRDSIIMFALDRGFTTARLNELLEKEGEPYLA